MGIQGNRLAEIQQCYFDVCDLLNGQSYKDIGYDSRNEMLEEFKERLSRIEDAYKEACGIEDTRDPAPRDHTDATSLMEINPHLAEASGGYWGN